ncbi:MAG: DUF4214 domain-containing protein [Gammaproteobacteria bacterium]|nr:DUF4214 domain-containing protein [Gammaproteobacteria bacterium]
MKLHWIYAINILLSFCFVSIVLANEPSSHRMKPRPFPQLQAKTYQLEQTNIQSRAHKSHSPEVIDLDFLSDDELLKIQKGRKRSSSIEYKSTLIGIPRTIPHQRTKDFVWNDALYGGKVSKVQIISYDAKALRVGLIIRDLPIGSELRFYSPSNPDKVHFLTAKKIRYVIQKNIEIDGLSEESQTYWSPIIQGDTIELEIYLKKEIDIEAFDIEIKSLSHIFDYNITTPSSQIPNKRSYLDSDTCNLDYKCYESTWEVGKSVAKMVYTDKASTYFCTGTLLANNLDKPYFLTANHCITTQSSASSLTTYWFYTSTSCNSPSINDYKIINSGGSLLYTNSTVDTTMLELNENPPAGVWFAGWSANSVGLNENVTGIHHPSGDLKKISFGYISDITGYNSIDDNSHIQVTWQQGITESGSSGSPLFLDGGYIVGVLHGGLSFCSSPNAPDLYGRFDLAYQDGLKDWLDATKTKENVTRLYVATFNRAPDAEGLDYWLNESGLQLERISQSFFDQPETQELYPPETSAYDFVWSVYDNLFNREPDPEGLAYWEEELQSGSIPKSTFILAVINGAQNTQEYGNDATILENKTIVGLAFADAGLNDVTEATEIMSGITDDYATVIAALETLPPTPNTIHITNDYQVESLGTESTISTTISIDTATSKSLYLVLSNYANVSGSTTITHNPKAIAAVQSRSIVPANSTQKPVILHAPQHVQDFNADVKTLFVKTDTNLPQRKTIAVAEKNQDAVGNITTFYLDDTGSDTTMATARKVVSNVTTNYGLKTLNVWVSDDSFGSGCTKSRCVTQDMVDALANIFLSSGANNDIYDWVSNIYEAEWGEEAASKYSNLIGEDNEITILLTDIDKDDSPNGGVGGYFWSKDNLIFSNTNGSNERVMFYIDSVMFANTDSGDFWQKTTFSTLAHELQHAINFYQSTVLLDATMDIWINEMLSESVEDLVATKIEDIGPRAVAYTDGSAGSAGNRNGRYPLFNANNTLSLPTWNNQLQDYSKVSAFGAYLTRNYGGAKLLHDIMHNTYENEQAIVDAVGKTADGSGKTFNNLLNEWGIAVLLSTIESPENLPTYNTGDFTLDTYNSTTYKMGSINFFNYDSLPTIYTTAGTIQAQANYYYKVGDNLTGIITLDLELNGQTEATLIAK